MNATMCELCGVTSTGVRRRWAWYRDSREPVQVIWRCASEEGCRARVEATGQSWPLREMSNAVEGKTR